MQLNKLLIFPLFVLLSSFVAKEHLYGQIAKTINTTFEPGEELTYVVSYNWLIPWIEVGEIKISVKNDDYNNSSAYHIIGEGTTFKSWDWFFKVRDRYESYIDTQTLKPFYFNRNIKEGSFKQFTAYDFDFNRCIVISKNTVKENPVKSDTISITNSTFDIISALFYARNLDLTRLKNGDTIPITIILDQELYKIYFSYAGIENIKIKKLGNIECIKFNIALVEGNIFRKGSHMTLWATNDKNRLPVHIESPIIVGYVKASITDIRGNRYAINPAKDN